jgi:UrcA family protein
MLARRAVPLFVALALLGAAPAALAGPAGPGIRIPYHDLDVTTDEGIAVLYGRVRQAARQVCGPAGMTGSRIDQRQRACMRDAIQRAIGQLGVPALSELHRELADVAAPENACHATPVQRRIVI